MRQIIGQTVSVRIDHEEKTTPASSDKRPFKSESWTFHAGLARPTVRYGRYLNRPPDFTGNYPSLVNSDTGIGFDSGAWGNWYRGNAIRVLVNDRDIFAGQLATTEKEIRQQIAYLREKFPEMPGLAFFPRVPDRLTAAVDRVIEDYFLKPPSLPDTRILWSCLRRTPERRAQRRSVGSV